MTMLTWFVEPLATYGFMRTGLLAAVVIGSICSLLSCLLVVRREALLSDAISHSLLLGVVIGFVVAGTAGLLIGALAAAILTGVAITFLERNTPIKADAAMGIVYTAAFSLALAIISVIQPRGVDLFHILFGNVLALERADMVLTGGVGVLVIVAVIGLFRWLHVWSFDPELAQTLGVPVRLVSYVFTTLLSATIVASMKAVGLLLVVAMLIIPGATAQLLTSRLKTMLMVAMSVGVMSAVAGLYGSFYVDVASGPAIVLTAVALFTLALAFAPNYGLVAGAWRDRRRMDAALADDLLGQLASHAPTRIDDLADHVAHRPSRVLRCVRRLANDGMVTVDRAVVTLTCSGRRRVDETIPPRGAVHHLGTAGRPGALADPLDETGAP